MNFLKFAILTILLIDTQSFVFAMKTNEEESTLNQQFEKIMKKNDLISLAGVSVDSTSKTQFVAVGDRRHRQNLPVTIGDKWHIGSITKSMTATLAAILVKEGVINWDTKLSSVWTDWKVLPSYQQITLIDLLSHRSGITDDIASTTDWAKRFTDKRDLKLQREEWAKQILTTIPPVNKGEFLYSNAGYVVAGAMLESVTKTDWESLMKLKLFDPLKMANSGFGAPKGDSPWGHSKSWFSIVGVDPNSQKEPADNPAAMGPAGTVHVTLQDVAQYIKLHLGQFPTLLNKKELGQMHAFAQADGEYGAGFSYVERNWANGMALTHSGSNTLWLANIWIAPKAGKGSFTVTNISHRSSENALDEAAVLLLGL